LLLVSKNQAIALETLNVVGMLQNHKLARPYKMLVGIVFVTKICYKAEWLGKTIFRIDTFSPSSILCHICGNKNLIQPWKIVSGFVQNAVLIMRDINAAINIKQIALKVLSLFGILPLERRDPIKGKQEDSLTEVREWIMKPSDL
jgi:putative transposase